jgi:type IV pilus assembly protein PilW
VKPNRRLSSLVRGGEGFTLIEVLVAIALSMLSMLIIVQVFSNSEARKRTTSGAAEAQQVANITLYQIGRTVRLGGSGLTQGYRLWGCPLSTNRGGTTVLPAPSSFPAPFTSGIDTTVRVLPVLIYPSGSENGSDALVVVAGSGEGGISEFSLVGASLSNGLPLRQTNGFKQLDYVLGYDPANQSTSCPIAQVDTTYSYSRDGNSFTPTLLPVGGAGTSVTSVPSMTSSSRVINLGASPQVTMFAVSNSNRLVQYDLLAAPANAATSIAGDVVEMRAAYQVGTDSDSDGVLDTFSWKKPTDSGYQPSDLNQRTAASVAAIDSIRAIRLALVVRSAEPSTEANPPTSYTIFDAEPTLKTVVSIPTSSQRFRYQVYEATLPLRNLRYIPPAAER